MFITKKYFNLTKLFEVFIVLGARSSNFIKKMVLFLKV